MQRTRGNRYVQRAMARHAEGQSELTSAVELSIKRARNGGRGLDRHMRLQMESAFAADFSGVRIHTGAESHALNRAVNAVAFTTGQDIFFRDGAYDPASTSGKELLAHELTHVVQQGGAPQAASAPGIRVQRMCQECEGKEHLQTQLTVGTPDDEYEQEAERVGQAVVKSFDASDVPANAMAAVPDSRLQRDEDDTADLDFNSGGAVETGGTGAPATSTACTPAAGITNSTCTAYTANAWWLPLAYVNNATCACLATPNVPTANCVRKFLQDRLAATPTSLKFAAATAKTMEFVDPPAYALFVQTMLTPRIYADHVDAYRSCCCPHGPAPYVDWIGVTTIPFQPCALVGWFINHFGSCTGTPGSW